MINTEFATSLILSQLSAILESAEVQLSDVLPSEWVEANIIMGKPFEGPYRYSKTPYCREIVDRLYGADPALWIAVMKGLQIGLSAGVIIPGMCYIIKESPGNTYFTVGAPDLIDKAVEKLDLMIDNAGLRTYIKPQVKRNKMSKSGDTNTKKDFIGGYINITTPNNHKEWRDVSLQYGFIDDFEAAKSASKESGSTRKLMEGRFAAYADKHKIFYISTPELKQNSNIEPAYLLGDQRKYLIPCPCCGEFIELRWNILEGIGTVWDSPMPDGSGIVWQLDDDGVLVEDSVGYVCQKCGGFFDDKDKHELLNNGHWQPTAKPSKLGYYSYHISSLYAPLGMYDWKHYVNNWLECNPVGQPRKESEYKTFVTTCLGICYEMSVEQPSANSIQRNVRPYQVGEIPEKLSISDGNGRIVLITCAADMNGKENDARLDYEIVAWSEKGASYSIEHGSIGTFIPRENSLKNKVDRQPWTYEFNKPYSVWTEFDKIIDRKFVTDTNRTMMIFKVGLDCGYFSNNYAYPYIDSKPKFPYVRVIGLKGKGEDDFRPFDKDTKTFMPAKERPNLYILTVGLFKDEIAEHMQLKWAENDPQQPFGFMNFPQPSKGLYGFTNFFEHFESEHRIIETAPDGQGIAARWQKKNSTVMNHQFDTRVYNIAVKEIIMDEFRKELKLPKITWGEVVRVITGGK